VPILLHDGQTQTQIADELRPAIEGGAEGRVGCTAFDRMAGELEA
jgi:hypothetical protein